MLECDWKSSNKFLAMKVRCHGCFIYTLYQNLLSHQDRPCKGFQIGDVFTTLNSTCSKGQPKIKKQDSEHVVPHKSP